MKYWRNSNNVIQSTANGNGLAGYGRLIKYCPKPVLVCICTVYLLMGSKLID